MFSSPPEILLLGANSMVGWSLLRFGGFSNVIAIGSTPRSLVSGWINEGIDLRNEASVRQLFERYQPTLILHAAGMCKVEKCENHPDFAHDMNVKATINVLKYAPRFSKIVYLSSDHVFGGDHGPYHEDTARSPISVYGVTRCKAEDLVLKRSGSLVIRSGLWIGPSAKGRIGHLDWLRYRHAQKLPITLISDEHRSALWSTHAAVLVKKIVDSNVSGVRHVAAQDIVDRPTLGNHLIGELQLPIVFNTKMRSDQPAPHLGNVDLKSNQLDSFTSPISGAMHSTLPREFLAD